MITCDQCKYWKHNQEDFWGIIRIGCCNPKWLYGYDVRDDELKDDEILIENDDGWGCVTGPKFGCVHGGI